MPPPPPFLANVLALFFFWLASFTLVCFDNAQTTMTYVGPTNTGTGGVRDSGMILIKKKAPEGGFRVAEFGAQDLIPYS